MIRIDLTVADLGELSTVHVSALRDGANAWVISESGYWTLNKSPVSAPSGTTVAPAAGSPISGAPGALWIQNAGQSKVFTAITTDGATAVPLILVTIPVGFKSTTRIHVDGVVTVGPDAGLTYTFEAVDVAENAAGTIAGIVVTVPASKVTLLADTTSGGSNPLGGVQNVTTSGSVATFAVKGHSGETVKWDGEIISQILSPLS